jgi:type II secretory pathway pseudopilin PulG
MTLVEVLVALALLGLVIGLVADVATQYSRVLVFSQEKDKASQAITALQELAREVEQCAQLVGPTGVNENVMTVVKVNADDPQRTEDLDEWDPLRAGERQTIEYRLQNQDIVRTQTSPIGPSTVLLNGVGGFSASKLGSRSVRLEISIKDGQEVKTFSTVAFLWADMVALPVAP